MYLYIKDIKILKKLTEQKLPVMLLDLEKNLGHKKKQD